MDLNRATIMGYVGGEPTFHAMQQGGDLAKFSVATSRRWKNKNSGEMQEDTQWHNIVVFNDYLVNTVRNMVGKGTRVFVEGELKTRKYDKDGQTHYITEIVVPQVKGELFVVEKGKGWDTNEMPGSERGRYSGSGGPQQAGQAASAATDEFDDDIPF